jgi:hypothetical protein
MFSNHPSKYSAVETGGTNCVARRVGRQSLMYNVQDLC